MLKQVLVARKDLSLRKGKWMAQAGHAVASVLLANAQYDPTTQTLRCPWSAEFWQWWQEGQRKITLSVPDGEALKALHAQALAAGLPAVLITDAGHTEFHGVPTQTILAIGPADDARIDPLTGALPLW